MFVNRISELDLPEAHYRSGHAELFVLYGRRRVRKTELLAHFCQGKWHVFFVSDQVPEQILRANLSKAVNDVIFDPGQVSTVYNTWDELLNTLSTQVRLAWVSHVFRVSKSSSPLGNRGVKTPCQRMY